MKDFKYTNERENFTDAFVQVINKDGTTIEPLSKNYKGLDRSKIKEVNVIHKDKTIYTLPIKGNRLIYRKRSIAKTMGESEYTFNNPKRAILLETKNKIVFVWDSLEIKELKSYTDAAQYKVPEYREDEKWPYLSAYPVGMNPQVYSSSIDDPIHNFTGGMNG